MGPNQDLPPLLRHWADRDLNVVNYYAYSTVLLLSGYTIYLGISSYVKICRCKQYLLPSLNEKSRVEKEVEAHTESFLRGSRIAALIYFMHANLFNLADVAVLFYDLFITGDDDPMPSWFIIILIGAAVAVCFSVMILSTLCQAVIFGYVCRRLARKNGRTSGNPYATEAANFISAHMLHTWSIASFLQMAFWPLRQQGIARNIMLIMIASSCWAWIDINLAALGGSSSNSGTPWAVSAMSWQFAGKRQTSHYEPSEKEELLASDVEVGSNIRATRRASM